MTSVRAVQVAATVTAVARVLEEHRDRLTELDAAVGDGDMGISVANAARAVREGMAEPPDDVGQMLLLAGEQVADAAGATIGALLSIGLVRAGGVVAGRSSIDLADIAAMTRAAEQGIRRRGKADVGDKTLLDALVPVADALEAAVRDGLPTDEVAALVVDAADRGLASTVAMTSRFGRARWLADRTVGHPDPGATVVCLMVRAALGR